MLANDAATYAIYTICFVLCRIPYSSTDKKIKQLELIVIVVQYITQQC
jgi:hypothetical protein